MEKENILSEFTENQSTINDFMVKMKQLINELLNHEGVLVHQITGRVKDRISLEKKIDRKLGKYSSLSDITDIAGIRIITYLESDVDTVAELIEKEFEIDKPNSVDKRNLRFDQFGYRSLHFVAECNDHRNKLIEYKRFKSLKFEIQIRSILQHAWAEIEHDLGYKGKTSIPDAYKRGFMRIAALLESADLEFDRLKKELKKYESEVPNLIKKQPKNVALDQASIISFNQTNKVLKKARTIIKKNVGCTFTYTTAVEHYLSAFNDFFDISTIDDLDKLITEHQSEYLAFVDLFSSKFDYKEMIETISIFYFQHFLAALDEDQDKVDEYVRFGFMNPDLGKFISIIKEAKTIANKY